jgi:hypothetical protein
MNCARHIRETERPEAVRRAKEREELAEFEALLAGRTEDCCTD